MKLTSKQIDALDWTAVRSSNVRTVAYDTTGPQPRLFVSFGKRIYCYDNVPAAAHAALLEASADPDRSVGGLFLATIRGEYECVIVEAHEP